MIQYGLPGEPQQSYMHSRRKEQKYIYAIRNRQLQAGKSGKPEASNQVIGSLAENFLLVIAPEVHNNSQEGVVVEQERSKFGQFLYSFEQRAHVRIIPENVLVSFPIACLEEDGRYLLTEEEFKKFIFEFKAILTHDESDDSSFSRYSESQQQISSIDHRCRGRPKGSKNKRKESVEKSSEEFLDESQKKLQEKRGRGRPKGAKNIKKVAGGAQGGLNELSVFQLFVSLFETKSIEEVNTKINRLKDRDDRLLTVKKEEFEGEESIKRSRGRPKGVKNKPKLNNEESESEQTQQPDSLPKRRQPKGLLFGKCCTPCLQKEHRKLFTEGKNILTDKLINLHEHLGPDHHSNPILNTIKEGEVELLRELLARKNQIDTPFVISWDAAARLEDCYYTVRTKKEYISKGRREGIHALIQDCLKSSETIWWKAIGIDRLLESIPNSKLGVEIYELLVEDDLELKREIFLNVASLVRSGNEAVAWVVFERVLKEEDNGVVYGYSRDHLQTLSKRRSEMQFKKAAMLKQSYTTNFCSPIHCAIINTNTELLTFILRHISEFSVGDSLNRKPIHYAAVLENSKALEILLKHGGDLKELDKRKTTPLMLAARFGRLKNLKIILEKVRDPAYINFKGDQGLAAIHYATIEKHSECVSLMLEDALIDKDIETRQGMTILHLAAANGQKDVVKWLLDRGNGSEADNFRRTAQMMAIRNYQNDIFFLLFQQCPRYYKRDYSYNTLLHYAAAYGNMEIVKYLLDVGMAQTMNRKSFYPFEIAILKGHYHCARMLENWTLHFSHHLLNRIAKNPRGTPEYYEIFEYLLETRKYDLNYRNPLAYGQTCLHFICSLSETDYYQHRKAESSVIVANQYKLMQEKLISLLLKYGADPEVENDRGEKPLKLCIQNENITGIQLLLREIPFEMQPATRNNNYVYYLTNIACLGWKEMEFVHNILLKTDDKILRVELRKIDMNGFEFLIFLIKKFTETVHQNFRNSFVQHREGLIASQKAGKSEEIEKKAVLKAFQDYLKHEEYLIKIINYLVDMGSDPKFIVSQPKMDEEYENYKKWGIQHFLMKFPSLNLLKIFMKWIDTNFNLQNSEGRTPLHLFCLWNNEGSLFNNYSVPNDPLPIINYPELNLFQGRMCLEYLLENGLTSNVLDINRSTPLLYAAMRGQLGFIKLLRNFGSTINNVNSLNQVPLIELIKMKNKFSLDQIEGVLSDEGLRANFKDLNERNALHHVVSIAKNFDTCPQICRKLLQCGVNVNSLDKHGRSPIFYCFIRIEQNEGVQDDCNDKVEILQTLLTSADIDINIVDVYQRTPLHYACEKKFFFSILYLLQKNIHYDLVDAEGNTPLAICLKHRNLTQAAMLIKRGVKYGNVVEDGKVYSYFTYAIQKLPVGICFILIDHGYPLDKALQQAHPFKEILRKRYAA